MKQKVKWLIWILLPVLFLVGWGEKKVELLDDAKLIDLNKAIEFAKPGGALEEKDPDQGAAEVEEKNIVISVRDQELRYNGNTVENIDRLEKLIREDNGERTTFSLADDWAEAHVYKQVLSLLSGLHAEIGIRYTKE